MYGCYCGLTGIGLAALAGRGEPEVAYGALSRFRDRVSAGLPADRDLRGRLLQAGAAVRWAVRWLEAHPLPGTERGTIALAAYPPVRQRWMAERIYETGVLLRVELLRRGWIVSEEHLERLGTDLEREDRATVLRRAVMLARMARGVPAAGGDPRVFYAGGR